LYIVGIGPGSADQLTPQAHRVLSDADVVAGYGTYIDLIRPLIAGKTVIVTPMKGEVERAQAVIDAALGGRCCALVSSGDAGIYAMAGLILELCRLRHIAIADCQGHAAAGGKEPVLHVVIVPGVPALCAGAALLGAPLTHDFAVISLSDLLTPWEVIQKRLDAAAAADFVIVLYNPKSRKRDWQLTAAQQIVLRHRAPQTPAGIVTRAGRDGQHVQVVSLDQLHRAAVDMQTTLFIGNSSTFSYCGRVVTPRGYARKYALQDTPALDDGTIPL